MIGNLEDFDLKYLKEFNTNVLRRAYESGSEYIEPYVSLVLEDYTSHYNKQPMCKLKLSDSTVIKIEGEGALTRAMTSQYSATCVRAEIGELCTSIGANVFRSCSGLTSCIIPSNSQLTSIGDSAFTSCSALTSINIPSGVTSIGASVFRSCSGLTSCTVPSNSQITSIGSSAFCYCHSLTSFNIPSGVTRIGGVTFFSCHNLTSISIPSGVTSIGNAVFRYCSRLTSCTIPTNSQLTSIGNSAFTNCSVLTSINIPSGVTSIGNAAFGYCSSLNTMNVYPTTPPTLGTSALANGSSTRKIYVPSASLNAYKTAAGWSAFSSSISAMT